MTAPTTNPVDYGWWLTSRSAAIVALVLVTSSVLLGLLMATRLVPRAPGLAKRLTGIHEALALGALTAIAVHGLALLGDSWLRPGLSGIAVPFTMGYRPLFTGLGILAGYLAATVGLTFYARRRIGGRRWRSLHRLSALVWVLAVVHALGAGSDAGTPVLHWFILGSIVPVGGLLAIRIIRGTPGSRRPAATAPATAHGPERAVAAPLPRAAPPRARPQRLWS